MSDIGITVSIETQADVAAMEKATSATGDLARKTDEVDESLKRLRETLGKADEGLKDIAASGEKAGEKLAGGFGGTDLANALLPVSNINEIISLAWSIGSRIGETYAKALNLSVEGNLDWDHMFGDGAQVDAEMLQRKHALAEVRKEYEDLRKELEKPIEPAIVKALKDITDQVQEAMGQMRELKALNDAIDKAADSKAADDLKGQMQEIDGSGEKESEKIKQRAAAQNQADEDAFLNREGKRQRQLEEANNDFDLKKREFDATQKTAEDAKNRRDAAAGIEGDDQLQRALASMGGKPKTTDEERSIKAIRDRLGKEAGYDDLGSVKDEDAAYKNALKARDTAARGLRDANRKADGVADRTQIESDADRASTDAAIDRRTRDAEAKSNQTAKGEAGKEAADAGRAAKEATKSGEDNTKAMADGLKQMASMVKSRDKSMSDALKQMAEGLKDGASTEELAAISRAMQQISQTSNAAFNALAKGVEANSKGVEDSLRIAQAAQRAAEQALEKANSTK